MFKIIVLASSLLLNVYLIYKLIDQGITYSYTLDSNKYLNRDINDTVRLVNYIFKESSRSKIETLGLELKSKESIFFKSKDKSCIVGPFKFIFDDKNITKKIIHID